jgi:hypothetical protein
VIPVRWLLVASWQICLSAADNADHMLGSNFSVFAARWRG